MDNYYIEVIESIKDLIKENKIFEAKKILDLELSMPYIPNNFEEEFKKLENDIKILLNKDSSKDVSLEKIEEYLYGDDKQQIQAVNLLFEKNLRNHICMIQDYFNSKPCKEAASLLIEGLIQQEISNTFIYIKDNIEYSFNPCFISLPYDSQGFKEANTYLKEWLLNDNPSLYNMALQILLHKAYIYLPLVYDEDESLSLALLVLKNSCDLISDELTYNNILKEYKLFKI